MTAKVLMPGWGFPSNVGGGLDTHVGGIFERLEDRGGVNIGLVLPAEYAPDREGIIGALTGEGGIITRVRRLKSAFAERAAEADIIHTRD